MAVVPIFPVCSTDPEVTAFLGTFPTRLYPFGEAPQGVELPYAVWRHIPGGSPENFLGNRPDVDGYRIQIDVYAVTGSDALDVAEAIRDAIEDQAYIVRWGDQDTDPQTKHKHIGFDVSWWTYRRR